MNLKPTSLVEVQEIIREAARVSERIRPRGGGSKPVLSSPMGGFRSLDMTGFSGVIEYEPEEYIITAQAGTRLAEVIPLLAHHGHYLPFDPLLTTRGATLGGTVASGLSGPGRFHYGGVRDFILGVRYIDGSGQVVYAGGRVVKNAAGFDLPKLMVGSLGRMGAFVELTFKVFPKPEAYTTLRLDCTNLEEALSAIQRLFSAHLDLDAVDLEPVQLGAVVWIRLAGLASALPARLERLRSFLGTGEVIGSAQEVVLWHKVRELDWVPAGWNLVKVPLTPRRIPVLDRWLEQGFKDRTVLRRYSSAGQVGWLAFEGEINSLDQLLENQGLSGLVILGAPGRIRLGVDPSASFCKRIKAALDPGRRFGDY